MSCPWNYLLSYGPEVEALAPASLCEWVRARHAAAAAQQQQTTPN
ncbi:hypothetical protein QMK33_03370 [Hymenobacter sp. H14-R3]|nr:hypothetical protein [Hymenobacter sp. H14-R3]MDJ0364179.1 hypothetical protein [Hymenobacter sp. H14-R3]